MKIARRIVLILAVVAMLVAGLVIPASAAETSVTVSTFANKGTLTSDKSSISWKSGDVTITNYKGTSTTAIRTSDTGHYRAYVGSYFTFEVPTGNVITKIVITCDGSSYSSGFSGSDVSVNGTTITITPSDASNIYQTAKITKQSRPKSITVTYEEVAGGDTPACEHTGGTATCEAKAICDKCKQPYGDLADHTVETVEGYAPTCTETGLTDGTKCSACDKVLTEQKEIPAAHNYVNGECTVCHEAKPNWVLVDNVDSLKAGDTIVIVARDYNFALSTTQNGNNRGQAAITKGDNTIEIGNDVQVLTLEKGKKDDTFAFYTGSGYLYAASSSNNYLRTETTLSDNSSWTITIAADGTATVVAQGSYTRNTLQYNQSSSLFACYASASQKAIVIYKLGVNADECKHTNTEVVPEVPATCTTPGVAEGVKCTDCGAISGCEEIPVVDHKDNDNNYKCDTCTLIMAPADGSVLTLEEAIKLGELFANNKYSENTYIIEGIIHSFMGTESAKQHGDVFLTDASGRLFYVYGINDANGNGYDKLETQPKVGDTIRIKGNIGKYTNPANSDVTGSNAQMKNGVLIEVVTCKHDNKTSKAAVAHTCTKNGTIAHSVCNDCGRYLVEDNGVFTVVASVDVPAAHTNVVIVPGKEATCTERGLTDGEKCEACGETVTAQTETPYADHVDANDDARCDVCKHSMPVWKKVTSESMLVAGAKYLIVYEGGSLVFNGSLETLDAVGNNIEFASATTANAFILEVYGDGWAIKSVSGLYIGQTKDANGLTAQDTALLNTISFNDDGTVDIISGGAYLRYNATDGQARFRYYKSGSYTNQKAISLYKLVEYNEANEPKFTGVNLNISNDLDMNIYAKLPEGFESAKLTFTFGGKDTGIDYLAAEFVENRGDYKFTFTGITPDKIADVVKITISVVVDGIEYTATKDYSILQYCEAYANKENKSGAMMTLLANLLVYGRDTLLYKLEGSDERVDVINELIAAKYNGSVTDYTTTTTVDDKEKIVMEYTDYEKKYSSENYKDVFKSSQLVLNNNVYLAFNLRNKFTNKEDGVEVDYNFDDEVKVVSVRIGGLIAGEAYTEAQYVISDGGKRITITDVRATEFDTEVILTVNVNGEQMVLYYSVNAYCAEMANDTNAELAALVKAIYNYGKAAEAVAYPAN